MLEGYLVLGFAKLLFLFLDGGGGRCFGLGWSFIFVTFVFW
jgi:hypothetical protein